MTEQVARYRGDVFERRIYRAAHQGELAVGATLLTLSWPAYPQQESISKAFHNVASHGGEIVNFINHNAPLEPKTVGAMLAATMAVPYYNATQAYRSQSRFLETNDIAVFNKEPRGRRIAKGAVKTAVTIGAMYGANKYAVHHTGFTDFLTDLSTYAAGMGALLTMRNKLQNKRLGRGGRKNG